MFVTLRRVLVIANVAIKVSNVRFVLEQSIYKRELTIKGKRK